MIVKTLTQWQEKSSVRYITSRLAGQKKENEDILIVFSFSLFSVSLLGLEIFSIGYSYWNVAITVCRKAVAIG
nr:hypothetical protein CFP56_77536 [Quercus suber]